MNDRAEELYKQITFKKLFLQAYVEIAKDDIDRMFVEPPELTINFWRDVFDGWKVQLKGFVMSNHLEEKYIEFPADWWQAFKDSFFPKWLLKIFPVIHRRIEISFDILYPDFKPKLPDERMVYRQSIRRTHD